jgi:hypothetical protein
MLIAAADTHVRARAFSHLVHRQKVVNNENALGVRPLCDRCVAVPRFYTVHCHICEAGIVGRTRFVFIYLGAKMAINKLA